MSAGTPERRGGRHGGLVGGDRRQGGAARRPGGAARLLGGAASGRRGLLVVAGALLLAAVAPDPVPLAAARLAALAAAVAGAWLLVGRTGVVDLAGAAMLGGGAVAGGVGSALLELPAMLGVPIGAIAGAVIGAVSGAVHGRVGRTPGALASLALGLAVVAAAGAWPPLGGAGGFHAVGLPAPGGERLELLAVGVVALLMLGGVAAVARRRVTAVASVSAREPAFAAASGHAPTLAVARVGAVAGAALGVGGALLASVDGSVVPGAYGLELTAALVLAALLGGLPPVGPVVGVLLVWGPGTVLPLVPWVGTSPPLLVMGPVGLALLLIRGGRPFVAVGSVGAGSAASPAVVPPTPVVAPSTPVVVPSTPVVVPSTPAVVPSTPAVLPSTGPDSADAPDGADPVHDGLPRLPEARRMVLRLDAVDTPSGPITAEVCPGEILAVTGPNGAGKSTLLARIGGQLPDRGTVAIGGVAAPRGAARRARSGIARSWQTPPAVPADDLAALRPSEPAARAAATWAEAVLSPATPDAASGRGSAREPGVAQLVHLVAMRPAIALVDEPTDVAPDALAVLLRGLATAGTVVVLVDHRPDVVAVADRHLHLGEPVASGGPGSATGLPGEAGGRPGLPTVGPST